MTQDDYNNAVERIVHCSSGTFRVSEEAMARKLAMERRKLWKHRAEVLWREVGVYFAIAAVIIGAIVAFLWLGRWVFGSLDLAPLMLMLIIPLICLYVLIESTYKRIKREWTPKNLGDKMDKEGR